MTSLKIEEIQKPIIIPFQGEDVKLPEDLQQKIDTYWDELIASGRPYKRGEGFTVTEVKETKEALVVRVQKTDYAHYLYSQNIDPLGEQSVRIIHTAGAVITKDNYIIFGQMGPQTARADIYQLCGGGLDARDITPEGLLDADHNIVGEFQEELGIDVTDSIRVKSFAQKYFKTGGPTGKMALIYEVRLNETAEEFLATYVQYETKLREQEELPEFGKVLAFSLDETQKLQAFLQNDQNKTDEYFKPFLEHILKNKCQ